MNPKDEQLIKRLIEKTNAKEITWLSTSKPMQFSLSMTANQLLIERIAQALSTIRYKFTILDNDGAEIESIIKSSTSSAADSGYVALRTLYEAARRNANNIDDTIDNLLHELN